MGKQSLSGARSPLAPAAAPVASSAESSGGKNLGVPAPSRGRIFLALTGGAILLGLLALLAYSNSFAFGQKADGLVLDNTVIIGGDPRIQDVTSANFNDKLHDIFNKNYWFPTYESNLYRPLTTLSYLVNYSLLGNADRPTGYHVVNFLLHWANIVLVLMLVRKFTGRVSFAMIAAGIFAVHPINVEAVTNIVGRADLFATLSILLGGWCYIKAGEAADQGRQGWWLVWIMGAWFNALWGAFAKESAIMILPFIFLYDMVWRWPRLPGPTFRQRCLQALVNFFVRGWLVIATAVVIFVATYFYVMHTSPVPGEIFADNPISGADTWFQGRMTAFKVLGRYLALLVYPKTLSGDYSYNQIPLYGWGNTWEDAQCWLSLAVVVGLLAVAWWQRRTQPLLTWGILLYFLMQLLTANMLLSIGSIMAERFQYLPCIGFAVVAAQLFWWLAGWLGRRTPSGALVQTIAAGALTLLFVVPLGIRTFYRNRDWHDQMSLWKSMLEASPNSFKVYKGYAGAILNQAIFEHPNDAAVEEKALDETIAMAEEGLAILDNPPLTISREDNTLFSDLGNYYRRKGELLTARGQTDAARKMYQKSLDVLSRARDVDRFVNAFSRQTQLARGRPADQIPDVGNYRVYELLSLTYVQMGDWADAEATGKYVVRLNPTLPMGYQLVAQACNAQGHYPEAAIEVFQALLLDNTDSHSWNLLIDCYQHMGINPLPLARKENTYSVDPNNPLVRDEINQAGVHLIRRFRESKLFEEADRLQKTLIKNVQIPPSMFDKA